MTHLPAVFERFAAQDIQTRRQDVEIRRLQAIIDGLQMDQLTRAMQELNLSKQKNVPEYDMI